MLLPGDWVTEGGYGSAEKKSENLVILKGEAELNSDNSHCGPVIKNPGLLEDGKLVDELYVYLDPAELEHAEKFVLTAGLKDVYKRQAAGDARGRISRIRKREGTRNGKRHRGRRRPPERGEKHVFQ